MEQKMKESQTSKKITEKNSAPEVLEELAKIPQEIIDKENAQEYIKWRFYKAPSIEYFVGLFILLPFFLIGLIMNLSGSRKADGSFLLLAMGFLLVLAFKGYDIYLRSKVFKKNQEENQESPNWSSEQDDEIFYK